MGLFDLNTKMNFSFKDVDEDVKEETQKKLKGTVEKIYRQAKSTVAVRTGTLKRSIKRGVKEDTKKERFIGWVSAGRSASYGKPVRYATIQESRRPYMKPAMKKHGPTLSKSIQSGLKRLYKGS